MSSATGSGVGGPNKLASLRAMFEKKDDSLSQSNSPPDQRGRSSGVASEASSRNGASPRPLSKVRTSFIAVGGTAGVVRSDSTNSDNPIRRSAFSMDIDTNPKEMADTKESLSVELDARRKSAIITEPIPESALETPAQTPALEPVDKQLGVKTTSKPLNGKLSPGKTSPVTKSAEAPIRKSIEGRTLKPAAVLTPTTKNTNGTGAKSPRSAGPVQAKIAAPTAKPAARPTTSAVRTKTVPATISTKKTITTPKVSPKTTRSPLPKTPTTPKTAVPQKKPLVKSAAPIAAPKAAVKTPEQKPSRTSLTSTASHKSPHKSPAPLKINGSPSAFFKPKPKSPTKPVQLPASLTAPTASSRSKTSQTTAPPPARSQSRATAAPTPGVGGIRRAQSVVKKSVIGPPPVRREVSKPSATAARPKSSMASAAAPSEGFMARMMRPTASSQSKTSDKTPPTPPKKAQPIKRPARTSTSRPSTRDSTSMQKAFDGSPNSSKTTPSKASEKTKEPIADAIAAIPKMEEIPAVIPESAAEAIALPILSSVKTEPVEEKMMAGEKTECEPLVDRMEAKLEPAFKSTEGPAALIETEEAKQGLPAEVEAGASSKEPEVTSEMAKEAEVKDSESAAPEGTAEQKVAEGKADLTEKDVGSAEQKENIKAEEASPETADVGETF